MSVVQFMNDLVRVLQLSASEDAVYPGSMAKAISLVDHRSSRLFVNLAIVSLPPHRIRERPRKRS